MEVYDKAGLAAITFKKICDNLPYNRNSIYAEIFLENSRCIVYMPIRDNLVANDISAKKFWEQLANTAEL